eukprot:COSAG04_NODE_325_length_16785_cov_23.851792_19_plen_454_part_00
MTRPLRLDLCGIKPVELWMAGTGGECVYAALKPENRPTEADRRQLEAGAQAALAQVHEWLAGPAADARFLVDFFEPMRERWLGDVWERSCWDLICSHRRTGRAADDDPNRTAEMAKVSDFEEFLLNIDGEYHPNPGLLEGAEVCPVLARFLAALRQLGPEEAARAVVGADLAFHGTSLEAGMVICHEGHDPSRRKLQTYGTGDYLSNDPAPAIVYAGKEGVLVVELVLRCDAVRAIEGKNAASNDRNGSFDGAVSFSVVEQLCVANPDDRSVSFCLPLGVVTFRPKTTTGQLLGEGDHVRCAPPWVVHSDRFAGRAESFLSRHPRGGECTRVREMRGSTEAGHERPEWRKVPRTLVLRGDGSIWCADAVAADTPEAPSPPPPFFKSGIASTVGCALCAMGLEEYTPAFLSEGITVANLPDLDDGSLRELGLKLGHRKTYLKVRPFCSHALSGS